MKVMNIDSLLFDDLMLTVFSFLGNDLRSLHNAGQTNRRWSRLTRIVWRSLKSLRFYTLFARAELPKGKWLNKALHYVLKKCGRRNLRSLCMYDPEPENRFVKINERTFRIIGMYCPCLEEIDFTDVLIINDLLHALVDNLNCANLKIVNLNSSFNHYCIVHTGLSALYSACTSVTYLNIANNLNARIRDCQEPWPPTLTETIIDNALELTSYSLMTLAKCCPNLKRFSMNGHCSGMDAGLEFIFRLASLEYLSLREYPGSVELGMHLCHVTSLTELCLTGNWMVCDDVVKPLAYSCQNLKILQLDLEPNVAEPVKIGRFTDDSLFEIGKYLPKLSTLVLSNRNFVSDDGLIAVIQNGNLSNLSVDGCPKISSVSVQVLSKFCTKLKYINTTSAPLIAEEAVLNLCKSWFYTGGQSYRLDVWTDENVVGTNVDQPLFKAFLQMTNSVNFREFAVVVEPGIRKTVCIHNALSLLSDVYNIG